MTHETAKLVRWDFETWEAIAAALGRDVRTVQRWAESDVDPLPVRKVGGRACARLIQLQAWIDRRMAVGALP